MRPAFRLTRGANTERGGVRFSVWAPHASEVRVRVLRGSGDLDARLDPCGQGVFEGFVARVGAGEDYLYRLDAGVERPDPVSRYQPGGVHGPSRIVDPNEFSWSDSAWRGVERQELVIYELHVGTFTEAGTFGAVAAQLAELRDLGVTAIELMPVAQFPGTRNWGYDGVFAYAPQSSYGGPDGLRQLVDTAHGSGLAVFLDVVYNHLGPEGNVLADFGPYFTDRYRTPWGSAVNFDGAESDEVRHYFLDNALHWITEYHVDGLRLDAVHEIHDESARPFLHELADCVHALGERLGRRVHAIAESDANDPRLVRRPAEGGIGLDAVWNDDFHHAAHAALSGEGSGYYADFGGLACVAKAFRDRFVYDGVHSGHRRRRHGAPARDLPTDRFVSFVQNHDQVGNRALGERLSTLLSPERQRLAAALLLLSPFVPLLFMGEEYGETAPFLYFVDHGDPELREAVSQGRRAEFSAFEWRGEIPDPSDTETFRRSRLARERAEAPVHAKLRALHRSLLQLRAREPALRPGAAEVRVMGEPEAGWFFALLRPSQGRPALAAFHLGPEKRQVPAPVEGAPWELALATDDAAFGGPGTVALPHVAPDADLVLPSDSALLYLAEAS